MSNLLVTTNYLLIFLLVLLCLLVGIWIGAGLQRRVDQKAREQATKKFLESAAAFTPNELRQAKGLPYKDFPLGDADVNEP